MRDDEAAARSAAHRAAGLDEATLPSDPFVLFAAWFDEWLAIDPPEPAAVVVATAGADARPLARNVLLRGVDRDGFVWFTNYASRKGRQLAENPYASLVCSWVAVSRQVVVTGPVERLDPADSDAYWQTRPRGSQLGAWASPQSEPVPDRAWLEARLAEADARFTGDVPRPAHWGGYRLVPEVIEFWQGRPNRLHDRIVYERVPPVAGAEPPGAAPGGRPDPSWRRRRLAP